MTDPYSFVAPDADGLRVTSNSDTITDDPAGHDAVAYAGDERIGTDVTEVATSHHDDMPALYFTRRVPRAPRVGGGVAQTVSVYGDNVPRQLLGENRNRCHVTVFTDSGNTVPVFVSFDPGTPGVAFAAGCLPFRFESYQAMFVKAAANATLYVVEESYTESD